MPADTADPDGRVRRRGAGGTPPWGRLRDDVVAHTLDLVCEGRSGLRVLDVGGGGDLHDAVHLARAGHLVTVADPSAALLARAEQEAAGAGCTDRLTVVETDVAGLGAVGLVEFDLVLAHDVVQHLPDVRRGTGQVVACAASGALVSLLAPNPVAEVLAGVAHGGRPAAALAALDAPTAGTGTSDDAVARVPVEVAERALVGAGCELVRRFGIGCVTDHVVDDDVWSDPVWAAEARELELALCEREPYLRVGRWWQVVARTF